MNLEHSNASKPDDVKPASIPVGYYDFDKYVNADRMLTFWHQIREVLAQKPSSMLEVGVGSRIVCGSLRELGIVIETADVNPTLNPDHVVAVQHLADVLGEKRYDIVLCARVLHHVPFSEFEISLTQLARISKRVVILTLPVDDLRLYLSARITSKPTRTWTVRFPLTVKRMLLGLVGATKDQYYRRLWKIGSCPENSLMAVEQIIERHFRIVKSYPLPEDCSHHLFVLNRF